MNKLKKFTKQQKTLEMAKGLTYLHDCGIVHRDLKPHNIFFEDGVVKIGDYSLSKAIANSHHSGHTMSVGTVHYMAPEIGEGNYGRSIDIYALGAILYCLLCGQPPLEGEQEQVLAATREGQIIFPSQRFPTQKFPLALEAVCRQAMALQAEDRYDSVQQLALEVDFFLKGYATAAEEAGAWQLLKLFYHRNHLLCRLTALFILVIISLTALFVRQQQQNLIAEENQRHHSKIQVSYKDDGHHHADCGDTDLEHADRHISV